jgi:DNA (cytosine-5)-methyltransferase 1
LYSAAEVGASHRRDRLFILGVADDHNFRQQSPGCHSSKSDQSQPQTSSRSCRDSVHVADAMPSGLGASRVSECGPSHPESGINPLVDAPIDGRREGWPEHELRGRRRAASVPGGDMGNSDGPRQYEPGRNVGEVGGWTGDTGGVLPLFPPGPEALAEWGRVLGTRPDLAPAQSSVRLVADGVAPDRARWLRMLGNGVVPLQAAYAFVSLFAALGEGERKAVQRGLFS